MGGRKVSPVPVGCSQIRRADRSVQVDDKKFGILQKVPSNNIECFLQPQVFVREDEEMREIYGD